MSITLQALAQGAAARPSEPDVSTFKPGQMLEALVLGKTPDGLTALKIGDLVIHAQMPQPLPPGTAVQLMVKTAGTTPQLTLVATAPMPAAPPPLPLPPQTAPMIPSAPVAANIAPAQPVALTTATSTATSQVAPAAPSASPTPQLQPAGPLAPPVPPTNAAVGPSSPMHSMREVATTAGAGASAPASGSAPSSSPAVPPPPSSTGEEPRLPSLATTSARAPSPQSTQAIQPPATPTAVASSPPMVTSVTSTTAVPVSPSGPATTTQAQPPAPAPVGPPTAADSQDSSPVRSMGEVPARPGEGAPHPPTRAAAPPVTLGVSPPPSSTGEDGRLQLPATPTGNSASQPQSTRPTQPAVSPATTALTSSLPAVAPVAASSAPQAAASAMTPRTAGSLLAAAPASVALAPSATASPAPLPATAPAPPAPISVAPPEARSASPLLVAQVAPRPTATVADLPRPPTTSFPVAASGPAPQPSTPQAALAQMVPDAMARQNSMAPLMTALAAIVARPAMLPEPVLRAALQVLAQRISIPEAGPTARTIETAIAKSGVFLEAALAKGTSPPADLKTGLLALKGALTTWLGGEPPPVAAARQVAPPLKGMPPRAESAPPAPPLPDAPREAARALHSQADAALSRVKLMQLASLPDADPLRPTTPELRLEVPFLIGSEVVLAQFQIFRDGARRQAERKRGWTMRFAMNFSGTGEVGAEVGLLGKAVNVALWAAEADTAERLNAALPELSHALSALGLEAGAIRVRNAAPDPVVPPKGHFVDSLS